MQIIKNTETTATLIGNDGVAYVFTPGLSLYSGDSEEDLDSFMEQAEGVSALPLAGIKVTSLTAFTKLVSGQMTVEVLRFLLKQSLKPGHLAALQAIAKKESIAV